MFSVHVRAARPSVEIPIHAPRDVWRACTTAPRIEFQLFIGNSRANCSRAGSFHKKHQPAASSFNRRENPEERRCTHLRIDEARTNASRQTRVLGSRHRATLRRENQHRAGRESAVLREYTHRQPCIPGGSERIVDWLEDDAVSTYVIFRSNPSLFNPINTGTTDDCTIIFEAKELKYKKEVNNK